LLATAGAEIPNDYDLLRQGAEWLADFLDKLIQDAAEFAHPILEIILLAIANLKTELVQLCALCEQGTTLIAEQSVTKPLAEEVLEFVVELATSESEHQKLSTILSAITDDFFADNSDLSSYPDEYAAVLEDALNEMTVFRLMSGMVAAPGSRHAGTNPTFHTAQVACEWLKTAATRFGQASSPEQKNQFRAELLAVIDHDAGKLLNPKFDAHHKLSLQLAGPGIKYVATDKGFAEKISLTNFLVHNHDICGHIAAKRRNYQDILAAFKKEPNIADYMRSLYYIQFADMQAITTMPQEHKSENISIWTKLCVDLQLDELVTEIVINSPRIS